MKVKAALAQLIVPLKAKPVLVKVQVPVPQFNVPAAPENVVRLIFGLSVDASSVPLVRIRPLVLVIVALVVNWKVPPTPFKVVDVPPNDWPFMFITVVPLVELNK